MFERDQWERKFCSHWHASKYDPELEHARNIWWHFLTFEL